jgi:hypothetical protein
LIHQNRLELLLSKFSLKAVQIDGDGNCLFTALIFQLSIVQTRMTSDYLSYLNQRGLLKFEDIIKVALLFREGVIAEMSTNWMKYSQFLHNCSENHFFGFLQQYSKSGQFAGDFGDLLPLACANYLRAVIVLFTSDPHLERQSIVPHGEVLTEVPLQLAYSAYGPGHYDATDLMTQNQKTQHNISASDISLKSTKCRCGANHTQLKTSMNDFCTTKRCPCFKEGSSCKETCTCRNCKNGKEVNNTKSAKRTVTGRKLGYKYESKLKRVTAIESLMRKNIVIKTRAWELKETLLLHEIKTLHPELQKNPVKFVALYNEYAVRLNLRKKTKLQILKKMSSLKG